MFNDRFVARANGLAGLWVGLGLAAILGGCANVGQQPPTTGPQPDLTASAPGAPGAPSPPDAHPAPASGAFAQAPTNDDAGDDAAQTRPVTKVVTKTTWYRARRGDTLDGIAQRHGVSPRELEAWNHLKPSSRLKAGQSLKIVSKHTITVQAAVPAQAVPSAQSPSQPASEEASSDVSAAEVREVRAEVGRHASSVRLAWPAQGRVIEPFQPGQTRGIEIAGKAGDPVLAAADGRVMYAGTGLNEYGSLIIVQHNKDFLTAYSHNRKLLVKTGDIVRQGQQIAAMGNEKSARVEVLFEVRRDGKPVDPMAYLPRRDG